MSTREGWSPILDRQAPQGVRFSVSLDADIALFDRLTAEQTRALLAGIAQIRSAGLLEEPSHAH